MDSAGAPHSALERELAIEQAHVNLVYEHLEKAASSAKRVAATGQDIYRSDRETWVREEDGTALFERDAFAFAAAKRLAIIDSEHEGLVFGRLDHSDGEIRYIGRIGVRDDDYEPLVIDWRARAAEPFYRATANDPMDVVRRRVLRCRNDIVIGIEDDLLDSSAARSDLPVIGEGALMAALKRARGPKMRDIVATIQAEQDEAIRAEHSGVTVIAGGPGTGKTVVALHRAAYLLYSNRRRFERGGILVIGPSRLFMDYIERVLPSLGEDSVTLRAIGQVAVDVLGFSSARQDAALAATVKGSTRMLKVLKELVALPLISLDPNRPAVWASVKGEVLKLSVAQVDRIRRDILARLRPNQARGEATAAILGALRRQVPDGWDLDDETLDDLIGSQPIVRNFLTEWWPDLLPAQVLRRLADPDVVEAVASGTLDAAERAALAESYQPSDFSVADIALLDELVALLGPIQVAEETDELVFLNEGSRMQELVTVADQLRNVREIDPQADPQDTFAHLLVDEAQDITPMQWRMLRRRGPAASWTIVGDPAQSSWPDVAETEQALVDLIGVAPNRRFRLSTNYRSPAEVFDLAARIVQPHFPNADLPHAVRSTGIEPALLTVSSSALDAELRRVVAEALAAVEGTVAVIAAPSRIGTLELPEDPRLSVVSPLNAKGLEFDAVVVVGPDEIVAESPGGIRVLYVALTRPTQRLVTIDLDGAGSWREPLAD
ncbi:DNA helicase IV [Propionicimonas paludicola]|uniref:DNA helicase IV n=1 Tax=Propionicimonas paludicola TaxID=185243 RepID=A0A2A9CVF4_9ACTN|nr:UvrD-helicase domain-containing protein [Propionicimonas paludicola]PFG17549.1 DNA helicase IV [Propionicimonas paludicola]